MLSHELRKAGIGGSDVAAILGLDEYRDPFSVWAEKRGQYERPPATARMKLGKLFERGIIEYYSELTGRETRFVDETYRSESREWMVYTPDALCIHERRGVDAKLVAWDQRRQWGPTPDDIPARVQLQVRYYMAAMDYPLWDIAALLDMAEPLIYTFERDPEIEEAMLELCERFYRDYILGDKQPPIGASDDSTEYLRQRFPRQRTNLREAEPNEVELLELYAQIRHDDRAITDERVRVENEIKLAIGEAEGLVWEHGRFTWRNTKDTAKTDWEALGRSLMRTHSEMERNALIHEYTETRPGPRRIWFAFDDQEQS
jgi:predicted phage-related endonuclease